MHECKPAPLCPHDHLMSEDGSGRCASELLDIGATEPTGEHVERRVGIGQFREMRPAVRV
jgi:hypothetical protein